MFNRLFVQRVPLLLALGLITATRSVKPAFAVDRSPVRAEFFSKRTTVWLGRTQVIAVKLAAPATKAQTLATIAQNPGILTVLQPATVLEGRQIGYLRVRGDNLGTTTLTVAGQAIPVTVKRASREADADRYEPRIVGPVAGAVVWGKFTVGVEVTVDPIRLSQVPVVTLRLPNGKSISPAADIDGNGPFRSLRFEVDADDLKPGLAALVAVARYSDGREVVGSPVYVHVVRPDPQQISAGECEAHLQSDRPKRYGANPPKVGSHPKASGGTCVVNFSAAPAWCLPVQVKQDGYYQMMVVARGDRAAGALPTIGLYIDEAAQPATTARLVDRRWHRIPVGGPVHLKAGRRFRTVYFMNDFYVEHLADRNLFLDRYELARLQEHPGPITPKPVGAVTAADPLRVAFTRPFDGLEVTGTLTIEGFASWRNPRTMAAPKIRLLINGQTVATQRAAEPIFVVDRGYFHSGANTLQMVATLANGASANTPIQTVQVAGQVSELRQPRAYHRFTALDERWDQRIKPLLSDRSRHKGHRVALFATNGAATLRLPDELTGLHDLLLDSRSENYKGPPHVTITLKSSAGERQIASKPINGWWWPRKMATVDLPAGPKSLTIAYTNDLAEKGKGDRNLWVRAVVLYAAQPGAPGTDHYPPRVTIAYPHDGHIAYGVDAVVVRVHDDDAVARADLYIDGQAQRMNLVPERGAGRLVFPLLLRTVAPGAHRLMVRVHDRAGNVGESAEVSFTVPTKPPPILTTHARAVRLLNRFAYGPEAAELAAVLTMGEQTWLDQRITRPFSSSGDVTALDKTIVQYHDAAVALRRADEMALEQAGARAVAAEAEGCAGALASETGGHHRGAFDGQRAKQKVQPGGPASAGHHLGECLPTNAQARRIHLPVAGGGPAVMAVGMPSTGRDPSGTGVWPVSCT